MNLTKHIINGLAAAAIVLSPAIMASCSRNPEAVNRMVKELNSPSFKAREVETGLFTDSSAKLDGDTLRITFFCRPNLNLAAITPDKLPALRQSALQEFKAYLSDRNFREGIEALDNNGMTLLLIWQGNSGAPVKVELPPAEILASQSNEPK